jgi:cyanate permease
MAAMILAHQGGWDEALIVLAPLVVIAALLWLANRRANAAARADRTDER